jgi:hypothetical protein
MDRQTALLLALAVLFVAGIMVGASGWILFARGGKDNGEGGRAPMKSDVAPETAAPEAHADEAASASEASEPGPS